MDFGSIILDVSHPRPTDTGVKGAIDLDVTLRLDLGHDADGRETDGTVDVEGEITLAHDHAGEWVAYGPAPDYWVSGNLLAKIQDAMCDSDTMGKLLCEIAARAARVIEANA